MNTAISHAEDGAVVFGAAVGAALVVLFAVAVVVACSLVPKADKARPARGRFLGPFFVRWSADNFLFLKVCVDLCF